MGKFTKDRRVIRNSQYSSTDIYYRRAKEEGYRARSAYKLLQIDDVFHIFDSASRIIDLCGSPGSWSQVCRRRLSEIGYLPSSTVSNVLSQEVRIVSVDLQQNAPIEGVQHIVGDITRPETIAKVASCIQNVDVILSDGAPDITGFHDMDQYLQSQLLIAALQFANALLAKGGFFVAKIFKGSQISLLYSQFKAFFRQIHIYKPDSSRESSAEHFIVGLGFHQISIIKQIHLSTFVRQSSMNHQQTQIFDYVTCGDLSGFDSKPNFTIQKTTQKSND